MHLVVLAFIGVRSYKHTIYCATKQVFDYDFSFVFSIGRSWTVLTTVLKIAVESVTLVLCDSRDYFASSLLAKKTIKFNRDFEKKKLLFIALVSNCSHRSRPDMS